MDIATTIPATGSVAYVTGDTSLYGHHFGPGTEVVVIGEDASQGAYICIDATGLIQFVGNPDLDLEGGYPTPIDPEQEFAFAQEVTVAGIPSTVIGFMPVTDETLQAVFGKWAYEVVSPVAPWTAECNHRGIPGVGTFPAVALQPA